MRAKKYGSSGGGLGIGFGEFVVLVILILGVLVMINSPSFTHREISRGELYRMYSPELLQEDLTALANKLEMLHPDLYFHVRNEEVGAEVQRIESRLTTAMNRIEFYRLVGPLLSRFDDASTRVVVPTEERADYIEQGALLLPLDFEVTAQSVTVSHNYSSDTLVAAGSEILAINGTTISQMRNAMVQYVSGDTESLRYDKLGKYWRELQWLIYGYESPFEITVRRDGVRGGQVVRVLLGVTQGTIDEVRASGVVDFPMPEMWSYAYQRREDAGLVTVNELSACKRVGVMADELVATLLADGASSVVFDLRGTRGSSLDAAAALLERFLDQPITLVDSRQVRASKTTRLWYTRSLPLYERWYPPLFDEDLARLWKAPEGSFEVFEADRVVVPANNRFAGNVICIVDGDTGPAAIALAVELQASGRGRVIGSEQPSPATAFFGESFGFDLPNTRLRIECPLERLRVPGAAVGFERDVVVEPTAYEIRRGLDSDLVRALTLAGS